LLDDTGRAYTLPAHQLPSARGQGEPVTGKVNVVAGAHMAGVMLAPPDTRYLLASDGGYGFVAKLDELTGKNRSGKSVLSLPNGCNVLAPVEVPGGEEGLSVAAVSNEGRLLLFPLEQ